MTGVKDAAPGHAFAWGNSPGLKGKFQRDGRACQWRQVGAGGDLAGRAMQRPGPIPPRRAAAEVRRTCPVRQRKGQRAILGGRHAVRKAGRGQGDHKGNQHKRPVQRCESLGQHAQGIGAIGQDRQPGKGALGAFAGCAGRALSGKVAALRKGCPG